MPTVLLRLLNLSSIEHLKTLTTFSTARLKSYATGKVKPNVGSVSKLNNAYRRIQYTRLRAAGNNIASANKFKGAAPQMVNSVIDDYHRLSAHLADKYGLDEADIIDGLAHSKHGWDDIDEMFEFS